MPSRTLAAVWRGVCGSGWQWRAREQSPASRTAGVFAKKSSTKCRPSWPHSVATLRGACPLAGEILFAFGDGGCDRGHRGGVCGSRMASAVAEPTTESRPPSRKLPRACDEAVSSWSSPVAWTRGASSSAAAQGVSRSTPSPAAPIGGRAGPCQKCCTAPAS